MGCGALNLDRLFKVQRITKGDEEVAIEDAQEEPGGSAANTIYALGKLNKKNGFIGSVGEDFEGKMVIDSLNSVGVDTSHIKIKPRVRTGLVIGIVDAIGERSLYITPGANSTLEFDEVDIDFISGSDFFHITSFVDDSQLNVQKKIVDTLGENTKLSFSPGSLYAKKGYEALSSIIRKTHVLFLNEVEVKILTGYDVYQEASEFLLDKGCNIVIVTLGENGCYITDGSKPLHIDAVKCDVVDTTGAGDAFCAGFLYGLSKGSELKQCGKIGNFVASRCISKIGARSGLPDIKELEEM